MNRKRLLPAAALLAGITTFGCGSERRGAPFTAPPDQSDPRVLLGHRVFSQHCYQCHPGGAAGLGPAINDKPLPVSLIKTQVRKGLGTMPAFSKEMISDEELDGVARYLKGLRAM